jgi:hypothetical protein
MTISIIQPCFVPWLGYFEQIALADIFVYMDDVQYTKKDWRNNNQLKTPNGVKGIFFPVQKTHRETLIKDVLISYNSDWQPVLLNQIREWYKKAPFFDEIFSMLEDVLQKKHEMLVDFNHELNLKIMEYIGINTPVFRTSDIPRNTQDKSDRIIEICHHFNGVDVLYDGKKAQDFIDIVYFASKGIRVVFQDYIHRPYPQLYANFVPYMSVLDLLMNVGKDALPYIITSKI